MPSKLLLIEDVEHLGRSGDIVSVKPGYARNYLLPQGVAVIADKQALSMQTRLQEERKKKALIDKQESEQLAKKLEGVTISTMVKIDQEGHMYGSVSALDVQHLLKDQASLEVERRAVLLKHPIKETGVYPITIRLKEDVTAAITLQVIPEEKEEFAAKEEEKPARGKKHTHRGERKKKKEPEAEGES